MLPSLTGFDVVGTHEVFEVSTADVDFAADLRKWYHSLVAIVLPRLGRDTKHLTCRMGLRKEPGFASQCVGCGKCEQHCPQHINIREKLKEADRDLRPLHYKLGINAVRKIMIK